MAGLTPMKLQRAFCGFMEGSNTTSARSDVPFFRMRGIESERFEVTFNPTKGCLAKNRGFLQIQDATAVEFFNLVDVLYRENSP
jgi:hypothetical protein